MFVDVERETLAQALIQQLRKLMPRHLDFFSKVIKLQVRIRQTLFSVMTRSSLLIINCASSVPIFLFTYLGLGGRKEVLTLSVV